MEHRKRQETGGSLDISQISHISSASVREQASQLDINVNACLHSTFNYPLHSTVNFMDMSLDLSKTMENECDTLVDSKYTVGSLNVNVIGGSTVHTVERTSSLYDTTVALTGAHNKSHDNYNSKNKSDATNSKSVSARHSQLNSRLGVNEQCSKQVTSRNDTVCGVVPVQQPLTEEVLRTFNAKMQQTENWVQRHDEMNWVADGESDCDSSCLSFDVDDVSYSLNDTVAAGRNISPVENCNKKSMKPTNNWNNNAKAVPSTMDILSQQLWGSSDRVNADLVTEHGTCDVCKLLKIRRQQGCTDLWMTRGDPPPGADQSSWLEAGRSTTSAHDSALTFADHFATAHELLHDKIASKKRFLPIGESNHQSPKRRKIMPHSVETPRPTTFNTRKSASHSVSGSKSTRKRTTVGCIPGHATKHERQYLLNERLSPEGSDDKENNPAFTVPSNRSAKSLKARKSMDKANPLYSCLTGANLSNFVSYKKCSSGNPVAANKHVKPPLSAKSVYRTLGECVGTNGHNALVCNPSENTPGYNRPQQRCTATPKSYTDLSTSNSPWATDKKQLKRKLKRLSKSMQSDKENVHLQPLGCI